MSNSSLKRRCPDSGTCHHQCGRGGCWRVRHCSPLSGHFLADVWPPHIVAEEAAAEAAATEFPVLRDHEPPPEGYTGIYIVNYGHRGGAGYELRFAFGGEYHATTREEAQAMAREYAKGFGGENR